MEYSIDTTKSRRLFKRAQKFMPGGVSHNFRFHSPYPLYIKEAFGGRFRDVDGNEFIDFWAGHTGLILGHNPPEIIKAVRRASLKGTHWGVVNKHQVDLAEMVCKTVPCAEQVRFCCSGTEATMYAVRLARGFTGRKVILKAEGGWHGGSSELTSAVIPPYDMDESMGLLPEAMQYTRHFPINDLDAIKKIIDETEGDFAGLIMEPFVASAGGVACKPDFLSSLLDMVRDAGGVFILDEVITGFRLAPGGAQEYYDIKPDLCTMGKNLGGGLPIGAIAGRKDIMQLASPQYSSVKSEKVYVGGGTYSGNPLSMVAGKMALKIYNERRDEIYPVLEKRAERLRKGMEEAMLDCNMMAKVQGLASVFQVVFPYEEGFEAQSCSDVFTKTDMFKNVEFNFRMMNHGVYLVHSGGALCT